MIPQQWWDAAGVKFDPETGVVRSVKAQPRPLLDQLRDPGGNPQRGDSNTARPAEKKVYGLPNAGARG